MRMRNLRRRKNMNTMRKRASRKARISSSNLDPMPKSVKNRTVSIGLQTKQRTASSQRRATLFNRARRKTLCRLLV